MLQRSIEQHGRKVVLEKEFHVDLHDPIGILSAVLPDDFAVGTAVNCPVRIAKMRSVKDVEGFNAKLQHHLLVNGDLLEKRGIQIDIAGPYNKISSRIPRSESVATTYRDEWRVGERCGVEVSIERALATRQIGIGYYVGP